MRLDVYLTEIMGIETRSKSQNLIKLGRVKVNGAIADKAGMEVGNKVVEIVSAMEYASMGGYKLAKAVEAFGLKFDGLTAIDVGASNGGFTSVMLGLGCAKIYALDVGECALPDEIKTDKRVVIKDRTNARDLNIDTIEGVKADAAVIDVSFISLKLILFNIAQVIKENGFIVALIKPQFEVGKQFLSKKGIVTDKKIRQKAIDEIVEYAKKCSLSNEGITEAPIYPDKNIEYLVLLRKNKI